MRMCMRVSGTLGPWLLVAGVLVFTGTACEPSHDPNYEGPPKVVKVLSFLPEDPSVTTTLYQTDDSLLKTKCDYDFDAGVGPMDATVGVGWGFRFVLSELIEGDEVEALDETGIGTEVYSGFVQITKPDGSEVQSPLDPTLRLTADALSSVYQPAGGSGCFNTVESMDISTGAPIPGPAIISYIVGVPSLPSNTTLALWLKREAGGHRIVDTGGTPMPEDFKVEFTTEPLFVDCPSPDACNVWPSLLPDDQPIDPTDPEMGFDSIFVQFTSLIGDPSGVYLYDQASPTAPVADVVATVDAEVPGSPYGNLPNAVTLTKGVDASGYVPLDVTSGHTYWIVVTSDVLDLWGVPVEAFDTSCNDLAQAGINVNNCIWAGTFQVQ